VADLDEAGGEDVEEEAADEFVRRQADRAPLLGGEAHARLVETPHAQRLQLLPDLALDQIHAVVNRFRVRGGGVDVGEAREVVQGVHQALHHIRLRLPPGLGPLPAHALLVVVELGGEAQVAVLETRQSLGGRLDGGRLDDRRLFGGLCLFVFLRHGDPGARQPACRGIRPKWRPTLPTTIGN